MLFSHTLKKSFFVSFVDRQALPSVKTMRENVREWDGGGGENLFQAE